MPRNDDTRSARNADKGKGFTKKRKPRRKFSDTKSDNSRAGDVRNTDRLADATGKVGTANDVAWYTKSPIQVANVANISFIEAAGKPMTEFNASLDASVDAKEFGAGGIIRCGFIPTFGNPRDPSDAMNISMQKTYADIRYANSGSRNYFAPDLMKYLMVMDSAFAFAGYLIRGIGFLNTFSSTNKYLPRALYAAMGLDFDDLKSQQPRLRAIVNNYISQINAMSVPDALPIFARHFWMSRNVYSDGQNQWSQLYVNVPEVYAKYNTDTADVDFIKLSPVWRDPTLRYGYTIFDSSNLDQDSEFLDVDRIEEICNDIVGNIYTSEDFNIMSGDILKTNTSLFKIGGVPDNYQLVPVYEAAVLNQMMNATALGSVAKYASGYKKPAQFDTVYQLMEDVDTQTMILGYRDNSKKELRFFDSAYDIDGHDVAAVTADSKKYFNGLSKLINITSDQPTTDMIMESTRLSATFEFDTDNIFVHLLKCGADVYTSFQLFGAITDSDKIRFTVSTPFRSYTEIAQLTAANQVEALVEYMTTMAILDNFDWHPGIAVLVAGYGDISEYNLPYFIDAYTYATVSKEVLGRIHDVANMSLFDITLATTLK